MAKTYRQRLGTWGEQLAAGYLQSKGYTILGCNTRTPFGEIDLIALWEARGDEPGAPVSMGQTAILVFVEVKTRTSLAYGQPEESITARKKAHLLAAIQAYMQTNPELPPDWRVDVIAVHRGRQAGAPEIVHFENAFC
jgi:putative endonuclease